MTRTTREFEGLRLAAQDILKSLDDYDEMHSWETPNAEDDPERLRAEIARLSAEVETLRGKRIVVRESVQDVREVLGL